MSNIERPVHERIIKWQMGGWGNVGQSSKAMVAVYCGFASTGDYPHDPSDFLRCKKLLEQVPEIREAFPKIHALSPTWGALIDNWDKIDKLLDEEMAEPGDMAPKTFKLIRELTW